MATTLEQDSELILLARLQADIMQCHNLAITFGQGEGYTGFDRCGLLQLGTLTLWINLIRTHQRYVRILPIPTRCTLIAYYNIVGHGTWHIVHNEGHLRVLWNTRESDARKLGQVRILIAGYRLRNCAAIAIVTIRDAHVGHFRFVHHMQIGYKVILLGLRASASGHVGTATTLSSQYITIIIIGSTRIAIAQRAAILGFRESKRLGLTLIAILAGDQTLALTLPIVHVATGIVDSAQNVARAGFTTLRIIGIKIPETILALITSTSLHIRFAVTGAGYDAILGIIDRITDALIQRTIGITIASPAHIRTAQLLLGITIEERHALLAMLTLRIMQTIVAHSARDKPGGNKDRIIEVAAEGVAIALAFLARVCLLPERRFPWQIIVEILASLAIQALGVVRTIATSVHHLIVLGTHIIQGQTL